MTITQHEHNDLYMLTSKTSPPQPADIKAKTPTALQTDVPVAEIPVPRPSSSVPTRLHVRLHERLQSTLQTVRCYPQVAQVQQL